MQFTNLSPYENDDTIVCVHGEPKSQPCWQCDERLEVEEEDLEDLSKQENCAVAFHGC